MERNADEGIGGKQGSLSIRLSDGKVEGGGNKMQRKMKIKLPPLLVSSPLPSRLFSPPPSLSSLLPLLSYPPPSP